MNSYKTLKRIITFSILPITIFSVISFPGEYTDFISILGSTVFWWIINLLILVTFWWSKKIFFDQANSNNFQVIQWYLLWNIFSFLRGTFIAENYWDWKALIGATMALLLPIVAYTATNKMLFQSILAFFIKYVLPLFLVFAFLISRDAYGFYLVPISFLILFFPLLTFRWKLILFVCALISIFAYLGARSNVIKFGIPLLLMLIYYFRLVIPKKIFEIVRITLFLLPFLLFSLAISGIFNVFKISEYFGKEYEIQSIYTGGENDVEDLTSDTRTGLYIDVLQTAQKYNNWLIGRSPARGNETSDPDFQDEDLTGRGERKGNEVAILNIFTWTGVIGVFFYFLVFYRASYLAINKSNNIFAKILGLFVAFRWDYAWVEDINYFTLTTYMLWLMLGFSMSRSFCEMSNEDVKYWIRGIFDKRYRLNYNKNSTI